MGLGEAGSNLPSHVLRWQEHHVLGKADVVRLQVQPRLAWEGWGSCTSARHPGNPQSRGAAVPSVMGSVSQSFKPALLLEKWLSPALAWVPKRCRVLPRVQANPQDAQPLSGDCPEPNTTCQQLGWPQGCSGHPSQMWPRVARGGSFPKPASLWEPKPGARPSPPTSQALGRFGATGPWDCSSWPTRCLHLAASCSRQGLVRARHGAMLPSQLTLLTPAGA